MPSGCRPKRATWYEYRGSGAGKFTVSDTGGSTAGRLNFTDQTPVVISYLCGGQGAVDIPGWSPDGNGVVCVSNSSPTK